MYKRSLIIPLFILLALLGAAVSAQDIIPNDDTVIDPNANISWPPPVYVLRGTVDIRGTADVPNLSNYFIEFRPLTTTEAAEADTNLGEEVEEPWFPVTLPSNQAVVDGVLGTWNTETTEDGLYEIRLTINVSNQQPISFTVSPLRIENEAPDFVVIEDQQQPSVSVTATPSSPSTRPTLIPSPTALSSTPQVTATLDANVRTGDSTDFAVITALRSGQSAEVIGVSSSGSGWYFIRLSNNTEGWIAPSVVTATGDFRSVPRIAPPPPPFTPTPIPTNTPIASGNLAGSPPSLNPGTPTCNVPFEVLVNITNSGTANTTGPATILIQDVHVASGEVQNSFTRAVPILTPGENYVVGSDSFNVSTFFNEEHRIVVVIDSGNNVAETNENDNILTATYTLQQGGC